MANERTITPFGRHVVEEKVSPGGTSGVVHAFNPSGMTKIEVLTDVNESGTSTAYVEYSFADAAGANSDWHLWDDATVSAYTIAILSGIRSAIRCTSVSHTVSWRVSI